MNTICEPCCIRNPIIVSMCIDNKLQLVHGLDFICCFLTGLKRQLNYEMYEQALEKGINIALHFLKFLFIGPPRSGKSTTIKRLIGELVNLHQSSGSLPSTGVAETHNVIIKKLTHHLVKIANSADSNEWVKFDASSNEQDKNNEIVRILYQLIHGQAETKLSDTEIRDEEAPSVQPALVDEVTVTDKVDELSVTESTAGMETINETEITMSMSTTKEDEVFVLSASNYSNASDDRSRDLSDKEKQEIEIAFEQLKRTCTSTDSEMIKNLLHTIINLMDTGGQPAFMDMLPTLTIGPALYGIFFKLNQELTHQYPVHYLSSDNSEEVTLDDSYCIKDVVFQVLSSIYTFAFPSNSESSTSTALLFGTHKDVATPEQIQTIQSHLQDLLASTAFSKYDLLYRASDRKLVFEIDNMNGNTSELQQMQRDLEKIINHFPKVHIPAPWLMFFILLKQIGKRVMPLAQCKEIASRLKMSMNLEEALWFFHHHIGSLMYYPQIKSLQNAVICDPQIVFDSVTNLIIETFRTEARILPPSAVERLQQNGQFYLSDLEKVQESKGTNSETLKAIQLVDLLEHHNIIAPIKQPSDSSVNSTPSKNRDRLFIMPAILKNATKDELKPDKDASCLMIYFKCGFVPFGAFSATIAHLVANQDHLGPDYRWSLCKGSVSKNKITFLVDNAFDVILISKPRWYEIQVLHHPKAVTDHTLPDVCNHTRQAIVEILETIITKFKPLSKDNKQFTTDSAFDIGFDCICENRGCTKEHLMLLTDITKKTAICCEKGTRLYLPTKQLTWFGMFEVK